MGGSSITTTTGATALNQATMHIQGTLRDSSGNPIPNATLSLASNQSVRETVSTSTRTDSNGNF